MGFTYKYKSDEDIARELECAQPTYLFSSRRPTIQERFDRFCEKHPEIYQEFRQIALSLYARGRTRYGSKAIVEIVRYNRVMSGKDETEPFKIDNDFSSRLARKLAGEDTRFATFFEFRELSA
jgi:hypothetical protein